MSAQKPMQGSTVADGI